MLVSVEYDYEDPPFESGSTTGSRFHCRSTAIEARRQFRPARDTLKPHVQGIQTPVVTGPAGDEIHTDQYGRIKVKFRWDRDSEQHESSSCWLRVALLAAGPRFGFVSIPRNGHEVVVDFLEGDPDRPLVTGVVYRGDNMPPWALPDNKRQSGLLSRSSKGGAYDNANAIRFEDKKGEDQLLMHAEKNQDLEVENDETQWVGNDRKKTIDHDETSVIGNDCTETVGKDLAIDADDSITITTDAASITMKKDGTIKIKGNSIAIEGSQEVKS